MDSFQLEQELEMKHTIIDLMLLKVSIIIRSYARTVIMLIIYNLDACKQNFTCSDSIFAIKVHLEHFQNP